jgi:hypothetical protein
MLKLVGKISPTGLPQFRPAHGTVSHNTMLFEPSTVSFTPGGYIVCCIPHVC